MGRAKKGQFVATATFKLVQLLTRDPDLSHEDFVDRWHGEHAEIAERLPNLQKYTVSVPTRPEHSEYDGVIGTRRVPITGRALLDNVAELYFESEDAMSRRSGVTLGTNSRRTSMRSRPWTRARRST